MPEEADPERGNFKEVLLVIVIIMVGFLFATFTTLIAQDTNAVSSSHPPQVTIFRSGTFPDYIKIKYDGGIDDAFVGNFSVTIGNETDYRENLGVGMIFYNEFNPTNTCVDVKAYDKAVRIYRPIGYRCL